MTSVVGKGRRIVTRGAAGIYGVSLGINLEGASTRDAKCCPWQPISVDVGGLLLARLIRGLSGR